jgi:hypothetical protein
LREIDGAQQETLVTLDANTGKELWAAPLGVVKYDDGGNSGTPENKGGDGPRCTPTIFDGRVVTLSGKLVLQSFDAASGTVVWTKDLIAEHAGRNIRWQSAASPMIDGGLVYVVGGGPDQSLLAFDAKDGRVVWKAFDENMTHATPVAATILGQRQIIFFVQSGLLAVEPKDRQGAVAVRLPLQSLDGGIAGGCRRHCLLLLPDTESARARPSLEKRHDFDSHGDLSPARRQTRSANPLEHSGCQGRTSLWHVSVQGIRRRSR